MRERAGKVKTFDEKTATSLRLVAVIGGTLGERGCYVLPRQKQEAMTDLYERLEKVGFPGAYVRAHILPDWWSDVLATYPFNRRVAELSISRALKIPLAQLVEFTAPLSLFAEGEVRFKHWQDAEQSALLPAVAIAKRAAELILRSSSLPPYRSIPIDARALREHLLSGSNGITLHRLVEACWKLYGVPVFHLGSLPVGAKKVDGMAFIVGDRPFIGLSSSRKPPAWLLWHLAHELGHIARQHLVTGDALDVTIDFGATLEEEQEANEFAYQLIYDGFEGVDPEEIQSPFDLIRNARRQSATYQVRPESIVINFGYRTGKWPFALKVLNLIGGGDGAHEQIRHSLLGRIDLDRLTETDRHFLCRVIGI